ncbi:MAG: SIR2 family NAD-dependent protein deacylase [Candidatus Heimdallarchaeota archaeon]
MSGKTFKKKLQRALELIATKQAESKPGEQIVALTGSGISKGSGIPTFRGKDGLWKHYNVLELATPQAFLKHPDVVWEWYAWRMNLILEKAPNPAHFALAKLEQNNLLSWVITQNVDNLHKRAGSKHILQVHGDIFRGWCMNCGFEREFLMGPKEPPLCPNCQKSFLRPGVVWFGESLDSNVLTKCLQILTRECGILLIIGTSGLVYPVADFPRIAKQNGALLIEINLEETLISSLADCSIFAPAEKALPALTEELLQGIK